MGAATVVRTPEKWGKRRLMVFNSWSRAGEELGAKDHCDLSSRLA